MNVTIALESRFERTPDGLVWTGSPSSYAFLRRYLDVFDAVRVLGRVRDVERPAAEAGRADGPGVSFAPVPYFVGPWQYVRQASGVRRAVAEALEQPGAVILRVPGTLGQRAGAALRKRGRPYAVEVIGDPHDVFAPGSVRSWLRPAWRGWYGRKLRDLCREAVAASYVTSAYLQRRFPPGPNMFTVACPDNNLLEEAFAPSPRAFRSPGRPWRLLLIGSLAQLYKAPDVLIRAVAELVRQGRSVQLTIVGEGKHRPELEALARSCGIAHCVRFAGRLPAGPESIRAAMDDTDLFVLPSRTEGLPRVLLEAMARGLPCVASTVGGIPELLPPEDLVSPGEATALAGKLKEVLDNPQRLNAMADRNWQKAREYHVEELSSRRRVFYETLRDRTAAWERRAGGRI